MGLVLWALTTSLAGSTAYVLVARVSLSRGLLDRALATLMVAVATPLACMYGLGFGHGLRRAPLGWTALLLHAAIVVACLWSAEVRARVLGVLRTDLAWTRKLGRDILATQELAAHGLVVALMALGVSCFIAWRFPSWSWDCVWYHVSTTNYVVQESTNAWVATNDWYINGYPRHLELLSAWNDLLLGSTRLDDVPQVPFAILGALAVAAFCRRVPVSPALSASLGAMWIALPAVALQIHTTHADIAAGALFLTGCYFLSARPFDGFARTMTFLAFGLYAGTKVTGLFHLALVSPVVVLRWAWLFWERGARGRRALEFFGLSAFLFALGGFSYTRNLLRYRNPFWPVHLQLPLLGTNLAGPVDPHDMAWPPAFFGAPGAFWKMLQVWYTPSGNYFPDVREGPFGIFFSYLAFPAFLILVAGLPWRKDRWQRGAVVGMGVLATLVPVAWWGRYVLGMAGASLVSVAYLSQLVRTRYLQVLISAAAAFLCVASYAASIQGYRALPTPFADAATAATDDKRLRAEATWLWSPQAAQLRDREMRPGDVVAYDQSMSFLTNLWTEDLRNRVAFVEYLGDDAAWAATLEATGAKWVSVQAYSPQERFLLGRRDRYQYLFPLPQVGARMYRLRAVDVH